MLEQQELFYLWLIFAKISSGRVQMPSGRQLRDHITAVVVKLVTNATTVQLSILDQLSY